MATKILDQQELKFIEVQQQSVQLNHTSNRSIICLKFFLALLIITIIYLGVQTDNQNHLIEFQKTHNTQREKASVQLNNTDNNYTDRQPSKSNNNSTQKNLMIRDSKITQKFENKNKNKETIASKDHTQNSQQLKTVPQEIVKEEKIFEIPKYVWVYAQDPHKQSLFVQRCLKNMQHFSRLSKFQMRVVNTSNYKQFVSVNNSIKIEQTIMLLQERKIKEPNTNLKDHFETIKKNIITLQILNENGGILVQSNILFTENFDWIRAIHSNVYVINKGSKSVDPNYIAFFNIDHGSLPQKQTRKQVNYEPESYMIKFPNVQHYFLAARQKQQYLTSVIQKYYEFLEEPKSLQSKVQQSKVILGVMEGKDAYHEALYIAYQMVLQEKQKHLDDDKSHKSIFALDYFGIFTINQRYFPTKISFTFQDNFPEKIYTNLAKYSVEQLEESVGPLRYIVKLSLQSEMNHRLKKTYLKDPKYLIHPNSFLAQYVILDHQEGLFYSTIQKSIIETQDRPWSSFPKIIWIYWDKGIQRSSLANKLCIENIRRNAKASNFQFREVNNSNLQQILGPQLYTKINGFMDNKKIKTFPQTMSDFVRLSLLAKYGGIYMDASYFSVQSFDWIIKIANYPSQFIFNRYGKLPKVFMIFNPHYGQKFVWQYDQAANTKNMWVSGYESNLIIAQPNQQFLWDWLQEHGRFITSPYEESHKLLQQYNVYEDKWTNAGNVYLAVMDAVRIAIGKKQNEINKKMEEYGYTGPKYATQYYGLWSTSGFRGQQKIRAHTNFDNTHFKKRYNSDNPFLWRYPQSYSEGILGKVNQLVKMYGQNIWRINDVLKLSYSSNFTSEVHPESLLSKYLYNQKFGIIKKEENELKFIKID